MTRRDTIDLGQTRIPETVEHLSVLALLVPTVTLHPRLSDQPTDHMSPHTSLSALLLPALLLGCSPDSDPTADRTLRTTRQQGDTSERLIGLSPVDERVVWASGTGGVYTRTTDGGATWTAGTVAGADSLQFRDVHAVSADTAYLLSIGRGRQSRIYETTDGGRSWTRTFTNDEPQAFFDCMDFWDSDHGIAFSDAVDGEFVLVRTSDGGQSWQRVPPSGLPPAHDGEGSFAASGTCLVTRGDSTAYFGTGAASSARVFRTTDRGRTWSAHSTPIEAGGIAGIASLAFRDEAHGAAMGGVMATENFPDSTIATIAVTDDGGSSWTEATSPPMAGIFGGAYVPQTDPPVLVAVGPQGIAATYDDGQNWQVVHDSSHWSVAFESPDAGWAVGPDGRITHLSLK